MNVYDKVNEEAPGLMKKLSRVKPDVMDDSDSDDGNTNREDIMAMDETAEKKMSKMEKAYMGAEYSITNVLLLHSLLATSPAIFKVIGKKVFSFIKRWKVQIEVWDPYMWTRASIKYLETYGRKSGMYKALKSWIGKYDKDDNVVITKEEEYPFFARDLCRRGSKISFNGKVASLRWAFAPDVLPLLYVNGKLVQCDEDGADFGGATHDLPNVLFFAFVEPDESIPHMSFVFFLGHGLPSDIPSWYKTLDCYEDDEDNECDTMDCMITSEPVTTRMCPYTQMAAYYPVVSQQCHNTSHVFGAKAFIESARITGKMTCPICSIPCTIDDLCRYQSE